MPKICTRCGVRKRITSFTFDDRATDGRSYRCRPCVAQTTRESRARNRASILPHRKSYNRLVREQAIQAYGGKCKCCSETVLDFLCIDHINGGGNKLRHARKHPTGNAMFWWLRQKGYPKGFQVLCQNCNSSKSNGPWTGVCPGHSKARW